MSRKSQAISLVLKLGLALGIGGVAALAPSAPTIAAERIRLTLSPLEIAIPIESLEVLANEGRITRDLKPFARRLKPAQIKQLRSLLTKRFNVTQTTVARATYSPMAESFLRRLGFLIQQDQQINGFYAMRSAVILAAADQTAGLTALNVLRKFPGRDIRIDINTVLDLVREFQTQSAYRDAVVRAIVQQAEQEAAAQPADFSQLPDLRQPGPYKVSKQTVTFTINAIRPTPVGLATTYPLLVDFYLPTNASQAVPLVIYTHGFGANRFNNAYVAEHLASHGIAVATPEHLGSNGQYRTNFLSGQVSDIISPVEFISRALDTTYLLDELEKRGQTDPEWQGKFNLEQVGVMGASFGGTTALALAGAELNSDRLRQECQETTPIFSLSPLLQCYAQYLPPTNYTVRDSRLKAAFAAYPLTSAVYGPEGMSQVNIPTLILSGTHDVVMSPAVDDQIHPFIWLQKSPKYLAIMVPGTHFSSSEDQYTAALPEFMRGPALNVGRGYQSALSVAFFKAHLTGDRRYLPYLSETYAKTITQPALSLNVVQSLTPQQIEQAYGSTPPKPIIPPPVVATAPRREPVLNEIRRSRVLRVAIRTDAAPFGYLDAKGEWVGYCIDAMKAFKGNLEQTLNLPAGSIEVVRLAANQANSTALVQQGTVQLACGPDAIAPNQPVTFSQPFFVSGTQLLVKTNSQATFDPAKIGILGSAADQAIATTYPAAQRQSFLGIAESINALQQLQQGNLDALANDGILLLGKLNQQGLALDNFSLLPANPLNCQFYGLTLPRGDNPWRNTVNAFINSTVAKQVRNQWFQQLYPTALKTLEYCTNPARR